MRRIRFEALFALCACLCLSSQAFAATTINSLPFTCSKAGERYVLGQNLTIKSGTGITINANDVTIDGNNKTITHSVSGAGTAININAKSNVEIHDVTITQSSYTGTGYVYGIKGSGSNLNIRDSIINVKARKSDKQTYGIKVDVSNHGDIQYCTFNLSGVNRFYGFKGSGPWDVHHNTVKVSNHTYPNAGSYPHVFYLSGNNQEYYNNDIDVGSDSFAVNLFAAWGPFNNNKIYDNSIRFASDHGRLFLMDSDTDNWLIYGNNITVTSNNTGSNSVSVFRIRTSDPGNPASTGHIIHSNIVDASAANKTTVLSIGDQAPASSGVRFYNNDVKSASDVITIYTSNVSDLDVYSNTIEYTGGGWNGVPVRFNGSSMKDIVFSNNDISGNQAEGDLVQVSSNVSSQVTFCKSASVDSAADIRGGGMVKIITSGTCQDDYTGDPPDGTSPPVVATDPPAIISITVN